MWLKPEALIQARVCWEGCPLTLSQIPTEIDIFVFALPEFRKVKKKKKCFLGKEELVSKMVLMSRGPRVLATWDVLSALRTFVSRLHSEPSRAGATVIPIPRMCCQGPLRARSDSGHRVG